MSLLFALASCDKDNQLETNQESILEKTYELPELLKSEISVDNNMMVFKDKESFDLVISLLETENEEYLTQYFSGKENLSEEELDQQMEADDFNPFLVYDTFEKYHDYNTLRLKLHILEDEWLENTEGLLEEEDPSLYPISQRCASIANFDGEYMIGNTIYRVENDGVVFEILNSDTEALQSIRNGQYCTKLKSSNINIIVHGSELRGANNEAVTRSSCGAKAYWSQDVNWYYKSDHKAECIIDIGWDGYGSAAKAKIKCYKKNWRNKWKRHWRSMGAGIKFNAYDMFNCNIIDYKSDYKDRDWAYYVSTHVYQGLDGMRVMPGEGGGGYFRISGYDDKLLYW